MLNTTTIPSEQSTQIQLTLNNPLIRTLNMHNFTLSVFVSENNARIRPTMINVTRPRYLSRQSNYRVRLNYQRGSVSPETRPSYFALSPFPEITQFAGHVLMSHYSSNDWKTAVDNLLGLKNLSIEISEVQNLPALYGGLIIPFLPKLAPFQEFTSKRCSISEAITQNVSSASKSEDVTKT